jgi:hypothetical protein
MDEGTALRRAALFCSTSRTPFPEQINVTLCCPKPLGGLFEARDPASSDTEDFKKLIVKCLRFPSFVSRALPFIRETRGTYPYFIPTQTHRGVGLRSPSHPAAPANLS